MSESLVEASGKGLGAGENRGWRNILDRVFFLGMGFGESGYGLGESGYGLGESGHGLGESACVLVNLGMGLVNLGMGFGESGYVWAVAW